MFQFLSTVCILSYFPERKMGMKGKKLDKSAPVTWTIVIIIIIIILLIIDSITKGTHCPPD